MPIRLVVVCLAAALTLLQVRLWVSEEGFRGVAQLRGQVAAQIDDNRRLTERNRRLEAEVADLRQGFSALEERARSDLGLIAPNESFFIFAGKPPGAAAAAGH
ncbi:MAG: septum formation initiator family protein [Gammaproteobacteria bacterium]|nr:MAG: septum formation initiator family protein [Gammaproteobacteria bacterium]